MGDDRLRPIWDFDDLYGTEVGFRDLLEQEETAAGKAEVLTQLARIEALRGSFAEADRLLDEAQSLAGSAEVAATRVDLERGRVRRSSGEIEASLPLFRTAFERASAAGAWFIAADAAHMAALAAPGRNGFAEWTARGIELAEAHPSARYWLGPLLNNLGWELYEAGEYDDALAAFTKALEARERQGDGATIAIARHAVGKTLRALGRPHEAAAQLERAVAWTVAHGKPDGWFHEELAEDYAATGRDEDAREHAQIALALLLEADPSFGRDGRARRLRELAR